MTSELYQQYYGNFFPTVSQYIITLLKENLPKDRQTLELGFGCGHLLFTLAEEGYPVSGIEIREDAFTAARKKLSSAGFQIELYNRDFRELQRDFDCIYTTGLLQCLQGEERLAMIEAISNRCRKAIIVVPEIKKDRNTDSMELLAVAGCPDYQTGNLAMELYQFFPYVREGKWSRDLLNLPDSFSYYICVHLKS